MSYYLPTSIGPDLNKPGVTLSEMTRVPVSLLGRHLLRSFNGLEHGGLGRQ